MKTFLKPCLLFLPLLLAACDNSGMRETLGLTRDAPDEFTVVSRPPLSVPPDFSLRPPEPGAEPRGASADAQARSLLTGKPASDSNDPDKLVAPTVDTAVTPVTRNDALSGSASSILKRAGADKADDDIRTKLGTDARTPQDANEARTLLEQIDGKETSEPTVDAAKEAERLRNNKDSGKPMTEGDVPEEKPKKRSLIDRIF